MREPRDLPALSREERLVLVGEWPRQRTEVRAGIDQLNCGGKRQAAPCSQGTREPEPKRPGRQPSAGPFRAREAPPPEAITQPPVDVQVTVDACPTCGGPLAAAHGDVADVPERPERPRAPGTQERVGGCRWTVCGRTGRGQPPDLAPAHAGATAHRLGAWVMAAAQAVPDGVGMPVRNVPAGLRRVRGGQLTPGARPQDALRRAAGAVGMAYAPWRAAGPGAPVVHTDATGGRVGGEPAPRMACETATVTGSQLRPRQRHDAVQEGSPADDPGVMVTDRGRSAEAPAFANVRPPHGVAHRQRSISDARAPTTGRARDVGEGLKARRQDAGQRWHASRQGPGPAVPTVAKALPAALPDQRRARRRQALAHQRRLTALGGHHDRGHLVRGLDAPRLEPTNTRAQRAWRPAVIAHHVSQCSKNGRGTQAFAAFTRVVRTLTQQEINALVEGLSHLCRSPSIQDVPQ